MIKIAEHPNELAWESNGIAVVNAGGKKFCVTRYQEQLFAFAYKCPHASGIMSQGHIDALGNVVCPLHRYKFDLKTGRNVTGEGFFLKRWPVTWSDDGVFVQLDG